MNALKDSVANAMVGVPSLLAQNNGAVIGPSGVPVETAMSPAALGFVLILSAVLFGIGLVGFLARRNMILMFLCTELMFQAAALAMVAFGRMHLDLSGQVFVIFILTVAAAEAALALGLVVLLYRRKETLSADAWNELRE